MGTNHLGSSTEKGGVCFHVKVIFDDCEFIPLKLTNSICQFNKIVSIQITTLLPVVYLLLIGRSFLIC